MHLLNCDAARTPLVSDVGVSPEIPRGNKTTRISLLSPDEQSASSPSFKTKNGRLAFTIPRLKTYTLAVVQME
jgi:hypothetical protein